MPDLVSETIPARVRQPERRVWHQPAAGGEAEAVCVLLDAEYYLKGEAPQRLAALQPEGALPPLHVTYVSAADAATRWTDTCGSDAFASYVVDVLVPEARTRAGAPDAPLVLGGLSLTGLAAVHAGLCHPSAFDAVISQSASAWWNDEWIVSEAARASPPGPLYRLVCGDAETEAPVTHDPPEGHAPLEQRTGQLQANERLRDALTRSGLRVSWETFPGGHSLAGWMDDLPRSLAAVLPPA